MLPAGSVAVAVMTLADQAGRRQRRREARVAGAVGRHAVTWPRNCWPSPKPEGSGAALAKNWMVKVVLGVLLSVPVSVVVLPARDGRRGQDREVLEVVGAGCGLARGVGGHAVVAEVDAETGVARRSRWTGWRCCMVARCRADGHAGAAVEGDRVAAPAAVPPIVLFEAVALERQRRP